MLPSIGSRARSRARTLVPALALVAGLIVVLAAPAYAATTVVNCPGDDLNAAIAAAASGDTLVINGTCSGNFVIGKKLNLLGATGATLDGAFGGTTLTIDAGTKVKVTDLTITGGLALNGGGIANNGTLTLVRTTVTGNSAGTFGGGVVNDGNGTLSVSNSTLSGNTAGGGGAIQNAGTLILSGSTLDGNSSTSIGGGLANDGTATVTNSTFSGNSSNYGGGIYNNNGVLIVGHATLSGNSAGTLGGGVYVGGNFATLIGSSILAGNSAGMGPDCFAFVSGISNGHNLIGNADNCLPVPQTGDQLGSSGSPIDPLLGPLASNGGPTQTMALGLASPAADAIPVGTLGAVDSTPLCPSSGATDQRGTTRPQGAACDMGAYELNAPWISAVTVDSGVGGSSPSVSGTITCSLGAPFAVSITLTQKKLKAVGTSPTASCGGVTPPVPWTVSVAPGTFAPGTAKVSFTATAGTVTRKGKVSITLT